jgi:hypothetical protein
MRFEAAEKRRIPAKAVVHAESLLRMAKRVKK